MRSDLSTIVACALALLLPSLQAVAAELPLVVNHQGRLIADAQPVNNAALPVRFSIHPQPSPEALEDALIWEASCTLNVIDGLYAMAIGREPCGEGLSTEHLPPGAPRFLEITVDGVRLRPRLRFDEVPHAALARHAARAQQAEQAELASDAALLEGRAASSFANASHVHDPADVTGLDDAVHAAGMPWDRVLEKPDTFTPSAHTHKAAEITDFATAVAGASIPWNKITSKPSTFPPSSHTHTIAEVTGLQSALDAGATQWTTRNDGISYSGQVGINTSSPRSSLEVFPSSAEPVPVAAVNGTWLSESGQTVDPALNRPFSIRRGNNDQEAIMTHLIDSTAVIHYRNDEAANSIRFVLENTDTEQHEGANANINTVLSLVGNRDGGRVGINTTSPGHTLDVFGGNGRIQSGYQWLTDSDARYKTNVETLDGALDTLSSLRGVRYDVIGKPEAGRQIGVIARSSSRRIRSWSSPTNRASSRSPTTS